MAHRESRQKRKDRQRPAGAPRYEARGRVWIDGPEGTFLGTGRLVLMERIAELGSITKAARSMGMSYRHAWELIESMNRQAPSPYVVCAVGGSGGGGTRITPEGWRAIEVLRGFQERFSEFVLAEQDKLSIIIKEHVK